MTAGALAPAPRAQSSQLDLTRGSGYPVPGKATPQQCVDYVRRLLDDSEQDAQNRAKRATQNLLFSDGRQHIDWSLRDKAWKDSPAVEGRFRVSMNHIRPILRSRAQRLLSGELNWQIIPGSNDHEQRDRAVVGQNTIAHRWKNADMEDKTRYGLWLAFSCGAAFLKPFWNPTIGPMTAAVMILPHPVTGVMTPYPVNPAGEPLMDEQGNPAPEDHPDVFRYRPGDVDTAVRSLFNIRVNGDAAGFDPSEGFRWLTDSEVVPIHVIKERWGDRAKNVTTVNGVTTLRMYEGIVRSLTQKPGASVPGGDLASGRGQTIPDKELTVLTEYWEPPSDALPEGRLIVVAGNELLYPIPGEDEDGLPQSIVPHVALYDERRPFDAFGRASVDDLIAPQKVINKQWAAILEELNWSGLGQWIMFDVPGLSDQITNLNGAHIKLPVNSALAGTPINNLVQRVQPGQVSSDRWRLIEAARATMWDIGAYHEIQRGQVPPGVDSGVAVQLLQEAENGQLADAVRGLKSSLIQWARNVLKLARWGYGEHEDRWIPAERPDLGFLVESVKGVDLPDPDTVDIVLAGFRPHSQAAFNAEIKEAMEQGWLDPREGMRLMDLGRGIEGAFESQTRHYARARRENLAIERGDAVLAEAKGVEGGPPLLIHPEDGSPFLLEADDDHEAHIRLHQEIALDDTKPWPVRQVMLFHIAAHRMVLTQQMMAAAEAEASLEQRKKTPAPSSGPTAKANRRGASDA